MTSSYSNELPGSGIVDQQKVRDAIRELYLPLEQGRRLGTTDYLVMVRRLIELGCLPTLEPLLPLALTIAGKPYTLDDHYPFSPLFRTEMPKNSVYMTGRQVGKTQQLAGHSVLLSNTIPFFRTLHVSPLYEQIRRFSNNYIRPLIDNSPIRSLWSSTGTENSVLQRSFLNNSMLLFSFALLDADRIRGIAADKIAIDEAQDMDRDHIPIIRETMSHSAWEMMQFTGTPKTRDNVLTGLWNHSSMAEWFVPCYHHSPTVWNIPSLEYHLDAMIGPMRDDISEERPGVVCYKCQKPINPRPPCGRWVHRKPGRRWHTAGYHIPQIILPLHYGRPDKWNELLLKREGWGNTRLNVFYNEVLGEPVDVGQKLVTETELRQAARLPWRNDVRTPDEQVRKRLKHYRMRVLAADWGGGGEEGVSFTALALLGLLPNGRLECVWGKRLLTGGDHLREAIECMHWLRAFKADLFAHDYTGAGTVRETVLVQAGFDLDRVMAIQLVRAASKSLIKSIPATALHNRAHYRLDKARSLLYTCQAIKLAQLSFFQWDSDDEKNPGLLRDFLALIEEKTETAAAGDLYRITKSADQTDDFAQAVNLGAVALWHANDAWPNFAEAARVARITQGMIEAAGNRDWGWEEDRSMRGFLNQP